MIKRLCAAVTALIVLLCLLNMPAAALQSVDPQKESSLTLTYKHAGVVYSGIEVKIFRVADVKPDFTFDLWGDFEDYPVDIHGVQSQAEWRTIATTLESYAIADGLSPTAAVLTDENGVAKFEKLLPGMYLTMAVRQKTATSVTVFESFVTVIPYPEGEDQFRYDVTAIPKGQTMGLIPGDRMLRVMKQWKDRGYSDSRPESVRVDIYKDGVLFQTVELTEENNWEFNWKMPDDGSDWTVVERNISREYKVTIVENGWTMVVTNVHWADEIPPGTGDTVVYWPAVLAMSLCGCGLILLALWKKRREV